MNGDRIDFYQSKNTNECVADLIDGKTGIPLIGDLDGYAEPVDLPLAKLESQRGDDLRRSPRGLPLEHGRTDLRRSTRHGAPSTTPMSTGLPKRPRNWRPALNSPCRRSWRLPETVTRRRSDFDLPVDRDATGGGPLAVHVTAAFRKAGYAVTLAFTEETGGLLELQATFPHLRNERDEASHFISEPIGAYSLNPLWLTSADR